MDSEASREWECPKCAALVPASDKFCTRCGASAAGVSGTAGAAEAAGDAGSAPYVQESLPSASLIDVRATAEAKLQSARKWLLAVSVLTLISGLVFFGLNQQQVEKEIRDGEAATAHLEPAERDAMMKAETGMTWEEAVAHDRGTVKLQLAINIGLALLYLGLWGWAKRNPLGAAVTALMLFVTTIAVNMVLDPKTIAQGVFVKVFFTIALVKAISAGYEARKAGLHQP